MSAHACGSNAMITWRYIRTLTGHAFGERVELLRCVAVASWLELLQREKAELVVGGEVAAISGGRVGLVQDRRLGLRTAGE